MPPLQEILNFLERRARGMINSIGADNNKKKEQKSKDNGSKSKSQSSSSSNSTSSQSNSTGIKCYKCTGPHPIYRCAEVIKKPLNERIKIVRGLKLCLNCLRLNHEAGTSNCKAGACRQCKKGELHNSILCPEFRASMVAHVTGNVGAVTVEQGGSANSGAESNFP